MIKNREIRAPQAERNEYIGGRLNSLFRAWVCRACVLGASMFMVLGFMDYFAAPEYFPTFLLYRIVVSIFLLGIFAVARKVHSIWALYALGYFTIAVSAMTIELMILKLGGHQSSYYVGMILLAVCAVAFIPARPYFHLGSVLLIYFIYVLPILLTEDITDFKAFFTANCFIATTFAAAFLTSYFISKLLVKDLGLQFDLEREKRKSERQLSENLPGIVYRLYLDGSRKMRFFNDMLKPITGYAEEELREGDLSCIYRLILPEDRDEVADKVDRAVSEGTPFEVEYRIRHKGGGVRHCLERGRPIYGSDGKAAYIDGIILDISDRKEAEGALRNSEEKYRALMDYAYDAVFLTDAGGNILEANKKAEDLTGFTKGEILGSHFARFHPVEEIERITVAFRDAVIEGTGELNDVKLMRKDGSFAYVDISGCTVDLGGRTIVHACLRDVTKRRDAEEEKRKLEQMYHLTQKLEALGELSSGISHDFNNVLAIILNNLELARMHGHENTSLYLDRALDAVKRGRDMVGNLLDFSRGAIAKPEPVNLGEIAHETVNFMNKSSDSDIPTRVEIMPGLWNVFANPSQLQQVVMNLYQNAREAVACAAGGRKPVIEFKVDNVIIPESVKAGTEAKSGEFVRLRVEDNGCGMDQKTLSRVFEPFFSTKVMNNRGIGLSAVYGIVKHCGGWLDVQSTPGAGTVFSVFLPRYSGKGALPEPRIPEKVMGGSETILVIDDEIYLADSTAEMLGALGYNVLVARHGEEALRLCKDKAGEIDLVIMDMVMPGLSGRGLFEMIKRAAPGARIIIASGNAAFGRRGGADWTEGAAFLSKPFSLEALSAKVREALGENSYAKEVKRHLNRVKLYSVREKAVPFNENITSSRTIYRLFRHMAYEPREKFIAVFLDAQRRLLAYDELTQGTSNEAVVHSQEVMRTALLTNATGVVLVHNHPSGNIEPSAHDMELTSRLVESCRMFNIEFLDHIIIGRDGYFSFSTNEPS